MPARRGSAGPAGTAGRFRGNVRRAVSRRRRAAVAGAGGAAAAGRGLAAGRARPRRLDSAGQEEPGRGQTRGPEDGDRVAAEDRQRSAERPSCSHEEFGVSVIGVAKARFASAVHAIPVVRGTAKRPLYVTAAGIPPAAAAGLVRTMTGRFRLPDALRRVDSLARGRETAIHKLRS
jgi:hypothetical protein